MQPITQRGTMSVFTATEIAYLQSQRLGLSCGYPSSSGHNNTW